MVLSEVEALAIAHRWYGEADVAKDTLVFTLPPSRQEIRIGSLVSFGAALDGRAFRVDKIDDSDVRKCQAVRLEPSVYNDAFVVSRRNSMKTAAEAAPVYAEVLDLPLVLDDEAAAGPVVAVGQEPWRGDVAVYARQSGAAVGAASIVRRPSMFGEFLSPVPSSVPSVPIKRDFIVKLSTPSHVEALMRRDPATSPIVVSWPDIAHCEILTWRTVEPLGGNLVAFQSVVRGEYGTEVTTGRAIGAGTELVVPVISNGRIPLSQQDSAGAVEFLVGPARKAYTDQSYTQASGFSAASSRPYAPCQARVRLVEGPRLVASWLRRSRAPVDSWGSLDPVLLEDSEIYSVRLILNQEVVSAFEIAEPRFSVSLSELGWRDGMPLSIEVCQIGSTGERGSVLRIPFEPRRP
jgi:hypothetical protein